MNRRSSPARLGRWLRRLAGVAAAAILPSPAQAAHPHALWRVVHLCAVDYRLTHLPAPCLEVDLAAGYAVVPDPRRRAHLLLVPTRRLTGIEDPLLLRPGSPNYWRQAWSARRLLAARVGRDLPRDAVGLAVNAIPGRSQAQLHIHISCVQPSWAAALGALRPPPDDRWAIRRISGERWRVRSVAGEDLGAADPFRLLAAGSPRAAAAMGMQTLVVIGAQLPAGPGFYILSRKADPAAGESGHGERLLDERCTPAEPVSGSR